MTRHQRFPSSIPNSIPKINVRECSLPILWTRVLSEICILRFSRGLVKRNFALDDPFKPPPPDPDAILNKLAVTRGPEEPSLASHSPLDPRVTDLIFRLLPFSLCLSLSRGLFNYVKWYRLLNFNRVKSFMVSVIARDRWVIIGWKRVIGKKGWKWRELYPLHKGVRIWNLIARADLKIFFLKSRKHCRAKIVKIESSLFFSSQWRIV